MTAMDQALAGMWRSREKQKLPYLLVNDVRGYFAEFACRAAGRWSCHPGACLRQ